MLLSCLIVSFQFGSSSNLNPLQSADVAQLEIKSESLTRIKLDVVSFRQEIPDNGGRVKHLYEQFIVRTVM